MGLSLAILNEQRYRDLGGRLRGAGFEAVENEAGNLKLQTWIAPGTRSVTVDFLVPPTENAAAGGTVHHFEADFAAIVTPGLDLAFKDRRLKELSGRVSSGAMVSRSVPVCGPGAFTVLKALAFGNRTEPKDAYDLFYAWRAVGVDEVARCLAALQPSHFVDDALSVIGRDFWDHEGPGPVGAARFIARSLDDETQADVVGYARQLLRSMA